MGARQDGPVSTALLVMTDGRDCIHETIDSALRNLYPLSEITEMWIHDDSASKAHTLQLIKRYPEFTVVSWESRRGFGGAIQGAWQVLREMSEADYVFHLEDDFTFNRPVDLLGMQRLLTERPKLSQVALRRQPWNDAERAAGGVVEQWPYTYHDHADHDLAWLEHGNFFTTNPCLYRSTLMDRTWPDGKESEGHFGMALKESGMNFAFWGSRDSGEWVTHIGHERNGLGY